MGLGLGNQQNLPRGVRHDLLIGEIDDIRRVFHNIGQYGDIIRILGQGALAGSGQTQPG